MSEEKQITPEQAFGILAAEHAQVIVTVRLLQAENAQLKAELAKTKEPQA